MIQKGRTGDELLRLWRRALRFACKRVSDRGTAEEIASEAIARLLARAPEDLLDEWTFVCRQVVQLSGRSRDQGRRAQPLALGDAEHRLPDPDAPSSVLEGLRVEEFLRIVREEAERLPEPDRRVVLAHLFEEMTFLGRACDRHARLSTALGASVARTRHQLSRGLMRLRARLDRRLRRADLDGAHGALFVLIPLLPRLLSRPSLARDWRRPSLLKSSPLPVGAGLGLLLVAVTGLVLVARGVVSIPRGLEPLERVASLAEEASSPLPASTTVSAGATRPAGIPMTRLRPAAARARQPINGLREDFSERPVQVIAPRCEEGAVVPLGDTEWRVQNLRTASCFPTENVNIVAIQADGLRIAADTNDEHGGYVGVHLDLQARPLEWELTVRVTVAHVEDPYHRPVPQCCTSYTPAEGFGDETLGWCTTRDGERVQVLALRSPGVATNTDYIVEPGIEHTIELTSLRDVAELRAWPSNLGERPAEPLAVGASLGELRRILFTGPNWKTFDYRVHAVSMHMLGGASYGTAAPNSAGPGARLAAWVDPQDTSPDRAVELIASGLPPLAFGRFVAGSAPDRTPFGRGTLRVAGARMSFPPVRADSAGRVELRLEPHASSPLWALGEEFFVQLLYSDPAQGGTRNATQGVRLLRAR